MIKNGTSYFKSLTLALALGFCVWGSAAYAQPANDNCANAILLTPNTSCIGTSGSTLLATPSSVAASDCAGTTLDDDVWYRFVATASSHVVSLSNINQDMVLSVYSGTCGALAEVDCADDPEELTLSGLTVGNTYYCRVWTFFPGEIGAFDICVADPPPPPTNNECAAALPIVANAQFINTPISATTLHATASTATVPSCSFFGADNDVWFSFVPTATTHLVSILNAQPVIPEEDFTLGMAVYSGNCNALTELECESNTYFYQDFFGIYTYSTPIELSALTIGQTYYVRVWTENYSGSPGVNFNIGISGPPTVPINDDANNAVELFVGAPCSGNIYNNVLATHSIGEPYANCHNDSEGEHAVWFKFTAPASGAVKISTDIAPLGTLNDSKIGLFQVTNANNYASFTIIGCDEDNGVVDGGYMSTIYATGLVGGNVYYVQVDGYSATATGFFCVNVVEINPTMLSSNATCADVQEPFGDDLTYNGWVSLVDEDGLLVANVKNKIGSAVSEFYGAYNIDGNGFGTPRQDGNGTFYLSRNYTINNTAIVGPTDVQFFFHPGEIATLAGVTAGAANLGNLNATRQESTICNPDFDEANGPTSVLLQNANGAVNGVSWIQVTTPGFSNFYLMGGASPLPIDVHTITAHNEGNANIIQWSASAQGQGALFELERSANGKEFSYLTTVSAMPTQNAYKYDDETPFDGINFYRIKYINTAGKAAYSNIVKATVSGMDAFKIVAAPNPVKNEVTVKTWGAPSGKPTITITDITGKTINTYMVKSQETTIDMSQLAPGMYLIKYTDAAHNETIKVNKQ